MENALQVPGMRKEIVKIALPSFYESLFTTFTAMIDSQMVSGLGVAAISAVSVTNQPKLFVFTVFFAINTVISILVAQNVGKSDRKKANSVFMTAVEAAVILSIVFGVLCAVFAVPIMRLCSGQEDTLADSVLYFRIIMLGMGFNTLFLLNAAALRGCGKTNVTFISNVISCCVNILCNYLLIDGRFGFPALGIKGAAIATVFGTAVALLYTFLYLLCNPNIFISFKFSLKNRLHICKESLADIWALWKHVLVENLLTRLGFLITGSITARIGSFSMSVYSVGQHLMNVNFALGSGLQSAAIALVGRSFGERDRNKVRAYSRRILFYGLISSLGLSALIALSARFYGSMFSADAEFIRLTAIVCWIVSAISPIQTVKIIYAGLLQGVGNARASKIGAVISVTLTQTIADYLLIIVLGLGLWGVWAAIFISQLVWLICLFAFYRKSTKAPSCNV